MVGATDQEELSQGPEIAIKIQAVASSAHDRAGPDKKKTPCLTLAYLFWKLSLATLKSTSAFLFPGRCPRAECTWRLSSWDESQYFQVGGGLREVLWAHALILQKRKLRPKEEERLCGPGHVSQQRD